MIFMAPIRSAAGCDGRTGATVNAGTIDSERQHVEQAVPDAEQLSGSLSQRWLHQDQESVRRQPIVDQSGDPAAAFLDTLLIAWTETSPSLQVRVAQLPLSIK